MNEENNQSPRFTDPLLGGIGPVISVRLRHLAQVTGLAQETLEMLILNLGSEDLLRLTPPERKLRTSDEFYSWIASAREEEAMAHRQLRETLARFHRAIGESQDASAKLYEMVRGLARQLSQRRDYDL